jgi:hypothetical protein
MTSVRGDLQTIRFGAFELDRSAGELRYRALKVGRREKPLQMLVESRGWLVARRAPPSAQAPDSFDGLHACRQERRSPDVRYDLSD